MTPLECLKERKIIAIVRDVDPACVIPLGYALLEGGIGMMEVTYRQREPESWTETAEAIGKAAKAFGEQMLIGGGTVLTTDQVRMTRDAGGRYIVTPTIQPEIIQTAKDLEMGTFPGAFTPTEMVMAYALGADAVKVFPAGNLGPEYIKAVRAPLSHIPLVAVGGVNVSNAADFLHAGCIGLGIGGNLVNREWIAHGDWGKITGQAKQIVDAVTE